MVFQSLKFLQLLLRWERTSRSQVAHQNFQYLKQIEYTRRDYCSQWCLPFEEMDTCCNLCFTTEFSISLGSDITLIEEKSRVIIQQSNFLLHMNYWRLFCTGGFECWSQFTGIEALIHKLAKVRILQGSSNSFFIIQLLINYKNKTNKFENLNNSFDNEQLNMQPRYFFLAPPGILKIRLMLSCWLTKYQWNSRYVIDRPCLQKRHLEDK